MENMKNKILVYDDNCPLCGLYSGQFVRWGMLPRNGRLGYSCLPDNQLHKIDIQRYQTEIALIDTTGGETIYGADSLMYILQNTFPMLKPLFSSRLFRTAAYFLYRFVSYNRKVIAPVYTSTASRETKPPFHLGFRLRFIQFSIVVSYAITMLFGASLAGLVPGLTAGKAAWEMLLIAGTGWVFQFLATFLLMRRPVEDKITYLGHLGVIMIIGVLILLPGTLFGLLFKPYWIIPAVSVLISFSTMLWQHRRRSSLLKLSGVWTLMWVLFLMAGACFWVLYFNPQYFNL